MPPIGQNKGGMPWGGKVVTWTSAFVIGVSCMTFFSLVMQPNPPVRAFSIVKKSKDVAHDKTPRKLLSSSDHHEDRMMQRFEELRKKEQSEREEIERLKSANEKLTQKEAHKTVEEKPEKVQRSKSAPTLCDNLDLIHDFQEHSTGWYAVGTDHDQGSQVRYLVPRVPGGGRIISVLVLPRVHSKGTIGKSLRLLGHRCCIWCCHFVFHRALPLCCHTCTVKC
mmetsp:Transcript_141602/g.452344  ORF Transcript_141602/g.452344 Transcript_141602/m.452344 type:complete len:223 (-) Transcript_141602:34-702(-)